MEKLPQLFQIGAHARIFQEKLRHGGMLPCQRPQLLLKMRIGETPEVEDEVRLGREAVPISERNKANRRLAPRPIIAKGIDQQPSKVMDRKTACVDDPVRLSLQLGHPLSLQTNPPKNCALRRKRMGATTFTEPPDENLIIRVKEDDMDCMSALSQSGQDLLQRTKELSLPNIDDKGNSIDPLF